MTGGHTTRACLLTPSGTGAIGVIRLLGPLAINIADKVFRGKENDPLRDAAVGALRFGQVRDGDEVIDDAVVGVGTSRGIPTVDISVHGGVRIMERVLGALECAGAAIITADVELLGPWLGDSLVEREAISALMSAKTERAARFLAIHRRVSPNKLRELAEATESLEIRESLQQMHDAYPAVRRLLDGGTIVIGGPVNSGKSTLFNSLVGRKAAVTSAVPGTTRDWVSANIELDGVPFQLVDTAGRHVSADFLEQRAIRAGADVLRRADFVLVVLDRSMALPTDLDWISTLGGSVRVLYVANKRDLRSAWQIDELAARLGVEKDDVVAISAHTGEAIPQLTARIGREWACPEDGAQAAALFTPRQMHEANQILSRIDIDVREMSRCVENDLLGAGWLEN